VARVVVAALALEFAILTAARSGEVLNARWGEIELDAKVWAIPPGRMKAGREHRVPLSARALSILAKLSAAKVSEFVFAGQRPNRPLSVMAMRLRTLSCRNPSGHLRDRQPGAPAPSAAARVQAQPAPVLEPSDAVGCASA
jgi:integrase